MSENAQTNLQEIMGWESFDVVRFHLGALLQGQMRIAKLESAYGSLIIGARGLQCETILNEIVGFDSFDVVRFDLEPLLQGKTRMPKLKRLITRLLLVPKVCSFKRTYKKSWAGNLLM